MKWMPQMEMMVETVCLIWLWRHVLNMYCKKWRGESSLVRPKRAALLSHTSGQLACEEVNSHCQCQKVMPEGISDAFRWNDKDNDPVWLREVWQSSPSPQNLKLPFVTFGNLAWESNGSSSPSPHCSCSIALPRTFMESFWYVGLPLYGLLCSVWSYW